MRKLGKLVDWNDHRGFGFIVPEGGGERVFVHIKAFRAGQPRPSGGEILDYVPTTDEKDRRRADDVVYARAAKSGARVSGAGHDSGGTILMIAAVLFLALAAWLALGGPVGLPPAAAAFCFAASAVTFFVYARDKAAASSGGRRIPENVLHLLSLAGGWPGALIAQRILRHKTRKTSFQVVFWITVAVNLAALAWLARR